jgi:hypothetical protein
VAQREVVFPGFVVRERLPRRAEHHDLPGDLGAARFQLLETARRDGVGDDALGPVPTLLP